MATQSFQHSKQSWNSSYLLKHLTLPAEASYQDLLPFAIKASTFSVLSHALYIYSFENQSIADLHLFTHIWRWHLSMKAFLFSLGRFLSVMKIIR